MIRNIFTAIILATASPAAAQVIPGIEIGQTKAAAIDVFVGTDWGQVTEHNRWLAANPWARRVIA